MRKICSPHVDVPENVPPQPLTEFVSVMEQLEENGRVFNRQVVKEIDVPSRFDGLKVSDFTLENLASIGAVDALQECKLIGLDGKEVDSVLYRANSFADSLTSKNDENA